MVRLDHTIRVATCTRCGVSNDFTRCRNAETLIIAADTFSREHRCHARKRRTPTAKPLDRWQSLFANVKT